MTSKFGRLASVAPKRSRAAMEQLIFDLSGTQRKPTPRKQRRKELRDSIRQKGK